MLIPALSPSNILAVALPLTALLLAGCSSSRKSSGSNDQPYLPRVRWYAHCDTCNWCKGSFKTTQEVQRVVSEHNMKLHDWFKVAYYDQNDCRK